MFGYSNLEAEKKSSPVLPYNTKQSALLSKLVSFWKAVQSKALPKFHQTVLQNCTSCTAKLPCIQKWPLEIVGIVRLVRIQSIDIVKFLIVDVHFNIGKNWVHIVCCMCNDRNSSRLVPFRFHVYFSLFFVFFFYFFAIVSFVTTTVDKLQFQRQVRLPQTNVIAAIRLKLKLYAVFIEWGNSIGFLFVGRQDIVNYWDFPSQISRHCHKRLLSKITRHD